MNDDTISRAAVVDEIEGVDWYHINRNGEMVHGANDAEHQAWYKADDIYAAIEQVPSAQPDVPDTNVGDMISRQAALDAVINLWADKPFGNPALVEIKDCIEALPSAQQWIPCSERLPEKPGQYYVSGGDKVWICEFLIIATTNIPNFIGGWCNDVANPVVQAWMPLPEPWKGERDG